jgi:hypothetical protein
MAVNAQPMVGTQLLPKMLGFVPPEPARAMLDIADVWTVAYGQAA